MPNEAPAVPAATRTVTLADFLEPHEITACIVLWKHTTHCARCRTMPGTFVEIVSEQLIAPRIERINKQLGQENDIKYLAYVVEAAMLAATKPTGSQQAN